MSGFISDIDTINELVEGEHAGELFEEAAVRETDDRPAAEGQPDEPGKQLDLEQQMTLLRDLLRIERENNETRRRNNASLQNYVNRLQTDFLRQQNDLAEALEVAHKIQSRKDSQLALVEETLREKEQLIEQLRASLANLDEEHLRREMRESLARQQKVAELEREQLRNQLDSMEQQLAHERVNNSQLLQQFQVKLDDQLRLGEREVGALRDRLAQTQAELDKLVNEPQHLSLKTLREDKMRLESQTAELNAMLDDSRNKYESLRKRMETLLLEQEQTEERNQEELDRLQKQHAEQRHQLNELKLNLDDKQEVVQIMQFNLHRSEKRVRNLLAALKGKEVTYREMISQIELRHEQELDKCNTSLRLTERRLVEIESELDRKRNELVKLQLEQENQLDLLRGDRDEQLSKLANEMSRQEKELRALEVKLARETEQSSCKQNHVEQLQRESRQFKEESKRLSIELTKCESKLYTKQQELNQTLETINELTKKNESLDESARERLALELDESRQHSRKLERFMADLKKDNEKLALKLRIAETNLSKISSAVNREHLKMKCDYERKLEQIKEEQSVFDRYKLRYKKYSYKLKKYCEHLKRVHEHLCNPRLCGSLIGPLLSSQVATTNPSAGLRRDSSNTTTSSPDKKYLLSDDEDDEDEDYVFEEDDDLDNIVEQNFCLQSHHLGEKLITTADEPNRRQSKPQSCKSQASQPRNQVDNGMPRNSSRSKLTPQIKRTNSGSSATNSPVMQRTVVRRPASTTTNVVQPPARTSSQNNSQTVMKAPLRLQTTNKINTASNFPTLSTRSPAAKKEANKGCTEEHKYYYISERDSFNPKRQQITTPPRKPVYQVMV